MGTSSSGSGPRPTTPLIPTWINDLEEPANNSTENQPPQDELSNNADETAQSDGSDVTSGSSIDSTNVPALETPNRYSEARSKFTAFSRNQTAGRNYIRDSLRSYVKKGSGGSSKLAKRMRPATVRISRFFTIINTFRERGDAEALRTFNLESYTSQPLLDVLSALTDIIFDNSSPYTNIQDDSINKLAYTNTINRIVEIEGIDLANLSNENIEVMVAIFIEETIATRVICDVGTSLFKAVQDCQQIIEVEETTYQIVSGLVRNQIMPEIIATQRGQVQNIERNIENIYRIAFDSIAGTNE